MHGIRLISDIIGCIVLGHINTVPQSGLPLKVQIPNMIITNILYLL